MKSVQLQNYSVNYQNQQSTDIIYDYPFEIVLNDNLTIVENNIVINETF
jgi:hypothetical protein